MQDHGDLVPVVTTPWWQGYVPKTYSVLREGYGLKTLRADAIAGLTVAIVAIPLSMALAIASGTTPDKGLITVVVAGILISLLGGCRVQVGGPAGAFVVVVFGIIAAHGYDGLIIATLMAGGILVLAGIFRLGELIRYMPHAVIVGFTAGIAVIIFTSQIGDLFGLHTGKMPGDFIGKWEAFWAARASFTPAAIALSAVSLAGLIYARKVLPKLPAFLVVIVAASIAAYVLHLDVATIGSVFGGIPHSLPAPHWPEMTRERVWELLPSAMVIAFLAGLESLLCAVVADQMTLRSHRSNAELIAQGVANAASALFGGMPATGTIARTATNIRAGARTPVAGILHAIFVLLCMVIFAPLASYIPLAALAAVLVIVAWNMSDIEKLPGFMADRRYVRHGDVAVAVITLLMTVLVDLPSAVMAGVLLSFALFVSRRYWPARP